MTYPQQAACILNLPSLDGRGLRGGCRMYLLSITLSLTLPPQGGGNNWKPEAELQGILLIKTSKKILCSAIINIVYNSYQRQMKNNNNVYKYKGHVTKPDRNLLNDHDSGVIWFTGLSASGKSTIAHLIEKELHEKGIRSYVFDGDNIRHGLNANLGFSFDDRKENIRRIVEVAKLFADAGIVVLASFITPLKEQREYIRKEFSGLKFIEIYVKCDIEECIRRDPKGQYQKARAGIIKEYTGISSPFEEPENPDIMVDTSRLSIAESVAAVLEYLEEKEFLALANKVNP